MAIWTKACSWSKFRLALDCPRQLEYVLDRAVQSDFRPDYYAVLGQAVQKCFELYFNQGVNLQGRGRSHAVMDRVVGKVLKSPAFDGSTISYPGGKNAGDFGEAVRKHVIQGYDEFERMGILAEKIESEVKWGSAFNGFRMFGLLDFVRRTKKGLFIYDGKGNAKKDADLRQLLYYALICHASGEKIAGGGLIYWQHSYEEVDLSPPALKEFVEGDFARGRAIFDKLKSGASKLMAQPAATRCHYCSWSSVCSDSLYRKKVPDFIQVGEVSFGD